MKYIDKAANNILLIDISVPDYQQVVDSVNSNTLAIVYDYNDTYEDLSNILQNYDISKGRVGIFFELNKPFLNGTFFETTSSMIELINYHKISHIDFLACNTLKYPEWVNYYKELPCIVGASDDETGNMKYGGDWNMESTGENIELIYFSNIDSYKHLLGIVTNSRQGIFGAGYASSDIAIMSFDSSNSTIVILKGTVTNQIDTYDLSSNGTITIGGVNNGKLNGDNLANMTGSTGVISPLIYTSFYARSTRYRTITAPSNDWILFITSGTKKICIFESFIITPNNRTFFNASINFNKSNGMAIYNNSRLFYSTGSYDIGTLTIIDATSTTTLPTAGTSSTYITSTTLGSSATYYPMQLTCDTNNNLYISMGNTSSTPINSNIKVYNISGDTATFVKTISFNDTFSQSIYGYYYSLKWHNNILYIGTYIGAFPSGESYASTSGYLFAYDTIFNAVTLYTKNSTYAIGGIDIGLNYICTSALHSNPGSLTSNAPLDTFSGFFSIKNTSYKIDII
jgi:hypothetical protein